MKLGHEAPSGAVYTDHPSEELRTYEGTGARARAQGQGPGQGGGNARSDMVRRGDPLPPTNGGGGAGAGSERQVNVAALLKENQLQMKQLQQLQLLQQQQQLLLQPINHPGPGQGTTTTPAATSNHPNLTPLNLPTPLPGMPNPTMVETSKTARVGSITAGGAGGVVNTGGSKSARGAHEPDLAMPALNAVTRKNGTLSPTLS